jgi:succinyl-CoA synthetase beta subunit
MLNTKMKDIIDTASSRGWVLEPEAKRLISLKGIEVPEYIWTEDDQEALRFARKIGYPVVAKVVSSQILHKSELQGVSVRIRNDEELSKEIERLKGLQGSEGVLIEKMVEEGIELIVGAQNDYQFGPVVLLGIGGTGVEIYKDTTIGMAPLSEQHAQAMYKGLKAHQLLAGYRGRDAIHLKELTRILVDFSSLVIELEDEVESIDLNPLICSPEKCVAVDARIILKKGEGDFVKRT